jgi:hypothetical protein
MKRTDGLAERDRAARVALGKACQFEFKKNAGNHGWRKPALADQVVKVDGRRLQS